MITNIYHLLENYFEGRTSAEEEKIIRHYFAHNSPDDDLKEYVSLFRYLKDESEAMAVLNDIRHESEAFVPHENDVSVPLKKMTARYWAVAAVAASLLIALVLLSPDKQTISQNRNYVWVDGKRMTDSITVRKYAELSLEKVQPENSIIEDQLSFVME
jgi:hypothetical protein